MKCWKIHKLLSSTIFLNVKSDFSYILNGSFKVIINYDSNWVETRGGVTIHQKLIALPFKSTKPLWISHIFS